MLILAESIAEMRTAIWQFGNLAGCQPDSCWQGGELWTSSRSRRVVTAGTFGGSNIVKAVKDTAIPCHRVINATGKISNPNASHQIERLAKEGLMPINGRINVRCHRWQP